MLVTREFYLPRRDLSSGALNVFLSRISPDQFSTFDVLKQGNGVRSLVTYSPERPLRLVASSIPNNAWLRTGALPTTIDMVFNTEVSEVSVTDNTFVWIRQDSTVSVDAVDVTHSDGGQKLTFDLPDLTGYLGTLGLSVQNLENRGGESPKERIQVAFNITEDQIPRSGDLVPVTNDNDNGTIAAKRLHAARGVLPQTLVTNFLRQEGLTSDQILSMRQVEWSGSTEIFILWRDVPAPVLSSVSPPNGASIAQEHLIGETNQIFLSFSEAVDQYSLTSGDGTDRVYLDGTGYSDLVDITLERTDDIGMTWILSGLDMLSAEGLHTLELKDIRNLNGEPTGTVAFYNWMVTPLTQVGSGAVSSSCEREIFAGDGVQVSFPLGEIPISACDVDPFVNGLQCDPTAWVLSGNEVVFDEPPFDGAIVWFKYSRVATP